MNKYLEGYHGTSKVNAASILDSKCFCVSGSERDWLGRGVYFFEKDRHQAYMFARHRNKLADSDISVIHANINVDNVIFIDLLLDEDRHFVEEYARRLEKKFVSLRSKIGSWEHKEGYFLDYLYRENPYGVVRAVYQIPSKNLNSSILSCLPAQIQICVKDPSCICSDSIEEVNCDDYRRV